MGRKDDQRAFDDEAREVLRELICCSPRDYGHESSLWTLDMLAKTSMEIGLVQSAITGETVRATLLAMDVPSNASRVLTGAMSVKKATGLVKRTSPSAQRLVVSRSG